MLTEHPILLARGELRDEVLRDTIPLRIVKCHCLIFSVLGVIFPPPPASPKRRSGLCYIRQASQSAETATDLPPPFYVSLRVTGAEIKD